MKNVTLLERQLQNAISAKAHIPVSFRMENPVYFMEISRC